MKEKKYLRIVHHYENCLEKHGDTHKGVDWPDADGALKRYSVMLDVVKNSEERCSLLDFGCGTAHLKSFLDSNSNIYSNIDYSGSDISSKFIKVSKEKFPENNFYCFDLLTDDLSQIPNFDYIVMNGVFTEKQSLSFDDMWEFFTEMLQKIFTKADRGIAFNVMSKAVDWERDDLFHVPTDLLIDFMTRKLSRNFVIRNDYGLYEYTVYLYK